MIGNSGDGRLWLLKRVKELGQPKSGLQCRKDVRSAATCSPLQGATMLKYSVWGRSDDVAADAK